VLVADGRHRANLSHEPERMGGNVGTARLVAEILGEQFFAPVRRREARLDRYLRNGESPNRIFDAKTGSCASNS
jgi:hypothetical protein